MNTQVILMEVISKANKLLNTFKSNGIMIDGVTNIPILSETSLSETTGLPAKYIATVKLASISTGWDNTILDVKIVEDINGEMFDTHLNFKYSPYAERPFVDYVERVYLEPKEDI